MASITETNAKALASLDAVARASAWNDRVYLTLANTNRAAKGDTRKVYVKGNVLTAEPYKGYMSDGAIASLDAIEAAAVAMGMQVVR